MTVCHQPDYPRPQMARKQWQSLNGTWDFRFDDESKGEAEHWFEDLGEHQHILVPFSYESALSGIGDTRNHPCLWYRHSLFFEANELEGKDLLLHFEGCDFETKVWVNGREAGGHRGGYARFSFDITDLVQAGENILTAEAKDSYSTEQPRGKQRWKEENFACWYLPTSGIWKTVWLEAVPERRILSLEMNPHPESDEIEFAAGVTQGGLSVCAEVSLDGRTTAAGQAESGEMMPAGKMPSAAIPSSAIPSSEGIPSAEAKAFIRLRLPAPVRKWSPEHPDLYEVTFRLKDGDEILDEVNSYFAMREIRIEGGRILLNGEELYQRLVLDQGYWKESNLTPENEAAIVRDLDSVQALGFSGLRKHQKTGDERFLYWCDVKGLLVWCEMPSCYSFTEAAAGEFRQEWTEIVKQNRSHPCIISWTPFNESWGIPDVNSSRRQQEFTEEIYALTKSLDPEKRPVISNDGWEHTVSDVITIHDYAGSGATLAERYGKCRAQLESGNSFFQNGKNVLAQGYGYHGQPILISEYGGIAFQNRNSGWGYGKKAESAEEYLTRYGELMSAIRKLPDVCGFCYTQLTDVQQEKNGLMDENRNFKTDPELIRRMNLGES
jgi:beta-galactosidase/beta-glucuronidase